MAARYVQPHVSQFDGSVGQAEACVPAALANGIAAQSGGARRPSAGQIHRLIPKAEESDPKTPGWSQIDADRAMAKINVGFDKIDGWEGIEAAHNAGKYVCLAGDSDQFGNSTCSGVFNGYHTIGIHPNEKTVDGVEVWWIDDPICRTGRWERKSVLKAYAQRLADQVGVPIRGGAFTTVVPLVAAPPKPPSVVLRYGGHRLTPRQVKRIRVPAGRKANVRSRPDRVRPGDVVAHLANGRTFTAYQRTATGASLAGSRVWYGNASGTRWLHKTSF